MKIRRSVSTFTLLVLCQLFVLPVHAAIKLSIPAIQGVQPTIKSVVPENKAVVKKSPATVKRIMPKKLQACPKLFARDLRVVRVVQLPGGAAGPTFRFVLDGTIANRGAAGLATAGLNVTQGGPGKAGKRIALQLFKQQVHARQTLDVNRDLHVTIQSDALSRAQVSQTVFKLNVTNLRNAQGACGEYNPTVSTLGAAQLNRALPVQVRGITQPVGILPPVGKPVVGLHQRDGGIPPADLLGSQKKQSPAPATSVKGQIGRVNPITFAPLQAVGSKPARKLGQKTAQGFGLAAVPIANNLEKGHGGFAPKVSAKLVDLGKPLTGAAGKSLLPPPDTGTRHLLGDDHTTIGGFAGIPGLSRPHIEIPVTGYGGSSLLPAQLKLTLDHLVREDTGEYISMLNRRSRTLIPLHTHVTAYLRLQNLGTEATNVSVTIAANAYRPSAAISVAPGGVGRLVTLPFVVDETDGEMLDAYMGDILIVQFKLVTAAGSVRDFSDGNNLDNKVNVQIKVGSIRAILSVSNIEVQLKAEGLSFVVNREARSRPVSEDIYVDVVVNNSGGYPSSPTTLDVTLDDINTAIAHDSQGRVKFVKAVGRGPHRTGSVEIPIIQINGRYIARIVFQDVHFGLWDFDRRLRERTGPFTHRTRSWHQFVAAGNYACGFPATDDHSGHHSGWDGSQFKIIAEVRSQGDNTAPRPFMGKFKMGGFTDTGCGAEVSQREL